MISSFPLRNATVDISNYVLIQDKNRPCSAFGELTNKLPILLTLRVMILFNVNTIEFCFKTDASQIYYISHFSGLNLILIKRLWE